MSLVNPYESPAREQQPPQTVAATKSKLDEYCRAFIQPAGLLSFFATLHFFCSLVVWLVVGGLMVWDRPTAGVATSLCWGSLPAVLLFAASLMTLVRSLRRQRFALPAAIAIYVISGCLFCFDVANERAQLRHVWADAWVLPPDVSKNTYFTWWWFEDHWLR